MIKTSLLSVSVALATSSAMLLPGNVQAHQIIETDGVIEMEVSGVKSTTGIGGTLNPEAIVTAAAGTKATVLCDDLSFWQIPSNGSAMVGDGCGQALAKTLQAKPGENDSSFPYVITPRYTTLSLASGFPIVWNEVAGAQAYRVTLQGEDGYSWVQEVEGTAITYDGAALTPELYYLIEVEADTGVSSNDGANEKLGFTVISDENAAKVQAKLDSISALGLSMEGEAIAKAKFYQALNFSGDAVMTLTPLAAAQTTNPLVYQTLGEAYTATGLNGLAEAQYEQVINLTTGDPNASSLFADAHGGLAVTNLNRGNMFEAGKWVAQAQNVYTALGSSDRGIELENQLMDLLDAQAAQDANNLIAGATRGGTDSDPFRDVVTPEYSACFVPGWCF